MPSTVQLPSTAEGKPQQHLPRRWKHRSTRCAPRPLFPLESPSRLPCEWSLAYPRGCTGRGPFLNQQGKGREQKRSRWCHRIPPSILTTFLAVLLIALRLSVRSIWARFHICFPTPNWSYVKCEIHNTIYSIWRHFLNEINLAYSKNFRTLKHNMY